MAIDHTNEVFGNWTVISKTVKGKVTAKCTCGNVKNNVFITDLVSGGSKSCGCGRKVNRYVHGGTHTKLYGVWLTMRNRCYCKSVKSYKDYGERDITVCKEWKEDFVPFRKWCIENGYKEGLQIDRINNDGNYEPNNCHWVTRKVNANNTRRTRFATINGETKTITQWALDSGINRKTLQSRLHYGWDDSELLIIPVFGSNQTLRGVV